MSDTIVHDHHSVYQVYKAVIGVGASLDDGGASLVHGLGSVAAGDELAAVAELEAALMLVLLRRHTGVSLSVEEWLTGPFANVASLVSPAQATALVERIAAVAGGLWGPPAEVLRELDPQVFAVACFEILQGALRLDVALTQREPDEVLAEFFAFSEQVIHGDPTARA